LNFLTLISQLLPIASSVAPGTVAGTSQFMPLVVAATNLIAYIQQQGGLTTEQILDRAGSTLDENEVELLKDMARLQGSADPAGGGH